MIKGLFLIFMMIGIIFLSVYYVSINNISPSQKIIYKYIPRTFSQEQNEPIYVSEIFKTMFSQPSVWIESITDDQNRNNELLNKYFISQK